MKFAPHLLLRIIFLVVLSNTHLVSAALERSVSASRQFIAYGANTQLRGAVCELAEKTKKNLLGMLQERDNWKTPIVLNLQFPQANLPDIPATARYFSQTGSGLKFQLDLVISANVDALAIQRELLRAILLEMIYRRQPDLPAGTVYVQPPEWLVEGMMATAPGQDNAALVEALSPAIAANTVVPVEEFLRQQPALLDSPAQLLHRAYSLAFLQLLLDEAGGPSRLGAYINNLSHGSNDPIADLKAHFRIFSDANQIEAIWKSKVASLGAARSYELLTFAETDRQLKPLLEAKIPVTAGSSKTSSLERLLTKKISSSQANELQRLSRSLMLVAATANPVMRPIVVEYQRIVELMAANKGKGLGRRLARVKSTHHRIVGRMSEIDDYMNWVEATKPSTTSGAFRGYLRAAEKSLENEPHRHDALSVYLDALEAQFSN